MTFFSFIVVALVSTLLAFAYLSLFVVFPAFKNYHQQAAKTSLAKSLRVLNEDALKNGKIKDGEYLHDIFYKAVLCALVVEKDAIKVKRRNVKHTRKDELRVRKFKREVRQLDEETRKIVNLASFSIAKVFWLNNAIRLPLLVAKSEHKREEYLIRSGQYMAVSERQEFAQTPCTASG